MQRRNFFLSTFAAGAAVVGLPSLSAAAEPSSDRAFMAGLLQKIAEPVLSLMSRGELPGHCRLRPVFTASPSVRALARRY